MHAARWGLLVLLAAVVLLVAGPLGSAGAGSVSNGPVPVALANLQAPTCQAHVEKKLFSQPSSIVTQASVGPVALAAVAGNDGSNDLVLYDGHRNSTMLVQAMPPGIAAIIAEAAAGGNFFVEFFNFADGSIFFEEVSPQGQLSIPSLPLLPFQQYSLIGSATSLFAAATGSFLAIDPKGLTVQADYSSLLPAGATVGSALVAGERLYIGGSQTVAGGGLIPFFGFIDRATQTETTLSPTIPMPPSLSGVILWIGESGPNVYFGGTFDVFTVFPTFMLTSLAGYLFEFTPQTGGVTNLSSLDPISKWGVQSIFDVGPTVVMNVASFSLTSAGLVQVSGTYVLAPSHTTLLNVSSLTGSDFVALYLESSLSGGLYFVGGLNESTGTAEIVAIPVCLLQP